MLLNFKIDTTAPWKKMRLNLVGKFDFHMMDKPTDSSPRFH